jgi:hypothetical protein
MKYLAELKSRIVNTEMRAVFGYIRSQQNVGWWYFSAVPIRRNGKRVAHFDPDLIEN